MHSPPTPRKSGVVGEVQRDRLLSRLDESPSTVVVISAPAGSGKSTLAEQWLARDPRSQASVRLALHMDDPVLLGSRILDALESAGSPAPEIRARLTGEEPGFSAIVLPALASFVASRDSAFILVLDDVHLISSPDSQRVLEVVCEATPSGSVIVLLTRSLTPEWLARLRTTGRLSQFDVADLNFDVAEAAVLLTDLGLRMSPSEVAAAVQHTEGWAVGLYLTALALRADDRPEAGTRLLPKGSDRIVADYLRSQVIAPLDEAHQRFLRRTSILDELTGPLCDAVLESEDSAAVLRALHQQVQLVIALDRDERTFRYHHLLAEELQSELHRVESTQAVVLHTRASLWFVAQGDRDSAIRHATASGDMDLVARLLWPEVIGCVTSSRIDRLQSWLAALTDRQISGERWLTMAAVWASLQKGDGAAMGRWSRIAESHAGADWRVLAEVDSYAATLAVFYALVGSGGLDDTRDLCNLALRGLAPDDRFRAPAEFLHGVVLTLQRDMARAKASLRQAEALSRQLEVPLLEADAKSWLGLLAIADGDRQSGVDLVMDASDLIHHHHLERLATSAHCITAQALVLAMVGDKAVASTTLATARRLMGMNEDIAPWFAVSGRLIQARTAIVLGDRATARLLISEAKTHMNDDLWASSLSDSLAEADTALAQMTAAGGPSTALTTAELRILQFLPSHLTLPQIGEHLFVSQSTVKTHVLSIYRKLDVGTRADAVTRARSLGLVEGPVAR